MRRDGRSNFGASARNGVLPDRDGVVALWRRQQHGPWMMRTLSASEPRRGRKARRKARS